MLGDETSGSGVDLRLAGNQPIRGLDKGHGLTLPAGKLSKKPLLQASCLPVGGNCTNSSSALNPPPLLFSSHSPTGSYFRARYHRYVATTSTRKA